MNHFRRITFTTSLIFALGLALASQAQAYSAIAGAESDIPRTIYVSWRLPSQAEADQAAVEGCREAAKSRGVAELAPACAVVDRQANPGHGALACGGRKCASGYGSTASRASDQALSGCRAHAKNCLIHSSMHWEDRDIASTEAPAAKAPDRQSIDRAARQADADIDWAARLAVATYYDRGVIGLRSVVQDCYRKPIKPSFGCVYLDTASGLVGQMGAQAIGAPTDPFFAEAAAQARSAELFRLANMTMEEINVTVRAMYGALMPKIEAQLAAHDKASGKQRR